MAGFHPWWPLARYSHWDAARNGKADAKHGIPEEDQEKQPAYVLQLKQVGEENIERISQQWKTRDGGLLAEYCKAKSAVGDLSQSLKTIEEAARAAREEERRVQADYTKRFHMTPFWYWVMIGAIAILEVPLNSIVFQLFGESQLLTLLMSVGLAVVLPLCAHLVGGLLRLALAGGSRVTAEMGLIMALCLAGLGSLAGIAYLREKFFEGSGVQKLLSIEMDYTTVTLVFFAINVLIFLVATVASYVAHDPLGLQSFLELRAARDLRRTAERQVKLIEGRLQRMQAALHEITARRQKAFERTRHEVDEVRQIIQRLISVYEQDNQRHRGSTKKPRCFEHYPEIHTRDQRLDPRNGSAQLEWDCQAQSADVAAVNAAGL